MIMALYIDSQVQAHEYDQPDVRNKVGSQMSRSLNDNTEFSVGRIS
jgi:hypothetical protein